MSASQLDAGFAALPLACFLASYPCCFLQGRALECRGEPAPFQPQQHSTARPGRRRRRPADARQQCWVRASVVSLTLRAVAYIGMGQPHLCPSCLTFAFTILCAILPAVIELGSTSLCHWRYRQKSQLHASACLTCRQVLSWGHPGRDAVATGEMSGATQRAAVTAQPLSNAASARPAVMLLG